MNNNKSIDTNKYDIGMVTYLNNVDFDNKRYFNSRKRICDIINERRFGIMNVSAANLYTQAKQCSHCC